MTHRILNRLFSRANHLHDARAKLAERRHRFEVAKTDVQFYAQQVACAQTVVSRDQRLLGDEFLALLNSGLSHRRILHIAKHLP